MGAAVPGWLTRAWAIVRAVFGVLGALAVVAGSLFIAIRGGRNRGGDTGGSGSAQEVKRDNSATVAAIDASREQSESVKRDNSEASKGLDNALDILRRARGRSGI